MGISQFPPASGGAAANYDFVVDMNDTNNNVIELGSGYIAGAYNISLASGDSSFDIYLLDENGDSVGYSNSSSIVATGAFETVVVLGVADDEVVSFTFTGSVSNATSEGDAPGAGAYLTSISPSDLPDIDDTANVIGGNFGTAVEIYFESGTVSTPAKQVARADSTALIVTRPDALDPALDPWDVKAINPGVTLPTGTNAHILAGTVDAGASPVWTTTSPLPDAFAGLAYLATVVATDADGAVSYSVTSGALPTGLSLESSTGVISGTATAAGTPTITATDEGGNANPREFIVDFIQAEGGVVTQVGAYTVHTFESSGNFVSYTSKDIEYQVLAGGGGAGKSFGDGAGGGGAGGFRSSISDDPFSGNNSSLESAITATGTVVVTVGAGGTGGFNGGAPEDRFGVPGSDSSFGTVTSIGGGGGLGQIAGGDTADTTLLNGGSGGGGGLGGGVPNNGGTGTAGQGGDGADMTDTTIGGGAGGAFGSATDNQTSGAAGITTSVTGSSETIAVGGDGSGGTATPTAFGNGGYGVDGGNGEDGQNGRVIVRYLT